MATKQAAIIAQLRIEVAQLTAMRDFIRTKLPALNTFTTEVENAEGAIDDICRAIDGGVDPTTPVPPEDPR